MRSPVSLCIATLIFLALGNASSSIAKAPCPERTPGSLLYPWLIEDVMEGDRYAEIYLDVTKSGEPLACRIGKTNIRSDSDRFDVCRAFMSTRGWKEGVDPSTPASGRATIKRKYVAYGNKHQKAEREARKRYFQHHPNVSPKCFPEGY